MKTLFRTLAMAAVLVVVTACGGNPEPATPPPPPAPAPTASRPTPPPPTTNNQADAARRAREAELARLRSTMAEMVFFEYDKADIRADSRAVLDRKARIMRDEPTVRIRVEGHADERGSTEYNLALGSRRAEAVRAYITAAGIQTNRIETVSFGEERPLERARSESAWSRNRRAQFVLTGGALTADQ